VPRVYLGIGSNIDPNQHLHCALNSLAKALTNFVFSPVYESEAVGFVGDNFLNLVVGGETELPVGELRDLLRDIESGCGRTREGPKFGSRTLDIDILTYGDLKGEVDGVELPRPEVLDASYVLGPLADIAGEELHPVSGQTYASLWELEKQNEKTTPLTRVDFSWPDKNKGC